MKPNVEQPMCQKKKIIITSPFLTKKYAISNKETLILTKIRRIYLKEDKMQLHKKERK